MFGTRERYGLGSVVGCVRGSGVLSYVKDGFLQGALEGERRRGRQRKCLMDNVKE